MALEWLIALAMMVGIALLVTFLPLPRIVFDIANIALLLYMFVVTASFWGAGAEQIADLINKIPLLAKIAAVMVGIAVGNFIGGLIGLKQFK